MPKLLIVDDQPLELEFLVEVLSEEGYELETASDGLEAQAILERAPHEFSAVLLDWVMPRMTGIELLQWMKSQPQLADLEAVMQSGKIKPEDAREGIENGAFYYLAKPTEIPRLLAVMRAAVANCETKRSLAEQIRKTEDAFKLLVEGRFEIRSLTEAEAVAAGLAATCSTCQRAMGLMELLVNAVEHGNLGITYQEKSQLLESGAYHDEIEHRLASPEHRDKRVIVTLHRDAARMRIIVKDEGPGFDYKNYLDLDPQRLFDSHGRGIFLANSMLDICYLDPGNQVQIDIVLPPTEPAPA